MTRRKFLLMIFLAFAALLSAIAAMPKKFFLWFVVGRRLESEREVLDRIVATLPPDHRFPYGEQPARVVLARDSLLGWEEECEFAPGGWIGRPRLEDVSWLVDNAMMRLTDQSSVPEAYRSLFKSDDRVAIKVLWTVHLPIVDPIIRGLMSIGMPPANIWLYDFRQLAHAWWETPEKTPQLWAREPGSMLFNIYAQKYGVTIKGGQYADRAERFGSLETQLERLLYDCTALINVPALKTHYLAETTMSLKNHQGSHLKPYLLHASLDVSLALLNDLPPIREKTRLVVMDATAPLYDQGPVTKNCIYSWKYNGILASRDPVALDTIGVSIIAEKRKAHGLNFELPRSHELLSNAERLRLGRHDRARIDLRHVTRDRA